MPTHEPHDLCALFPGLSDTEHAALRDSIAAVGLLEPITLLDGKILDGLHRYRACSELGIEARFVEFTGADPLEYVLARNLHRRHLSEGQRAMVAAAVATFGHGGDRRSDQGANLRHDLVTRDQAADKLKVSPRSVDTAAKVGREAPPEVAEAVRAGAMSLNLAAQVAALPPDRQAAVAAAPPEQIGKVAREAVGSRRTRRAAAPDAAADRIRELEEELERVRDGAQEAVAQAEAAHEVLAGDPAKAILRLREQLRVTELRRDELMRENAELKAEVKRLQRKLGIRQ